MKPKYLQLEGPCPKTLTSEQHLTLLQIFSDSTESPRHENTFETIKIAELRTFDRATKNF